MDKLKELLDGLVEERSLSFEVLEQLRKVKTESDELIKINKDLKEELKGTSEDVIVLNLKILTLEGKVKEWEIDKNGHDTLSMQWLENWHNFIDHLASNKPIDDFFNNLIK